VIDGSFLQGASFDVPLSSTSWTLGPSDSSKPSRTRYYRAASSTQTAANTIVGRVIDQAEIVPDFRDPEIRVHAHEAIQRCVPLRSRDHRNRPICRTFQKWS
jgi:hypothetical protein